MPEQNTTPNDELRLLRQQAFLLHQLATAPNGTLTQTAANKAIPTPIKNELAFKDTKQINDLRWKMVVAGWLTEQKANRVVAYTITDAGRQQLRELESYVPLLPAGGTVNQPATERIRFMREVYVLNSLDLAPQHSFSKAELEMGFGGKGHPAAAILVAKYPHLAFFRSQSILQLNPATTRGVLNELALSGDIQVHQADSSESYTLTPSGSARLKQMRVEYPVLPPTGKATPAPNDEVTHDREAFILLKLLQCAKYTLWASDAGVGSCPKSLKLNHATAWVVRDELSKRGLIGLHWDGKEGCYTLTPVGKQYLATLPFDALGEVKIKGSALTDLLATARESTTRTNATLTAQQLESAVLDIFDELLRGPHANLRMVPIHELRSEVTKRLGLPMSSHNEFNELLLSLRRTDKLRLVSLDDPSKATPEQRHDSVSANGETYFYAKRINVIA